MKNGNNKHADGLKGGVGDKGVATAPRGNAKTANGVTLRQNLGLDPDLGTAKPILPPTALKRDVGRKVGMDPLFSKGRSNGPHVSPVSDLEVTVLQDEDGRLYYLFEAGDRELLLLAAVVLDHPQKIPGELAKISILANSKADRDAIKLKIDSAAPGNAIVTTLRGYERCDLPRYFVYGDGTILKANQALEVYPTATANPAFSRSGNLKLYERKLAPVLRDQSNTPRADSHGCQTQAGWTPLRRQQGISKISGTGRKNELPLEMKKPRAVAGRGSIHP